MSTKQTLIKVLTVVLLFIGIAFGQSTMAQTTTWTVNANTSGSNTTFSVTRTDGLSSSVTVRYRLGHQRAFFGCSRTLVLDKTLVSFDEGFHNGEIVVNGSITTDGLNAGIYVLRLIDGTHVKTQKIIVE
jgi:hypothetical protein